MLTDNPEFVKIIIAWKSIKVHQRELISELSAESETEQWAWLWENTHFNSKDLKDNLGTSLSIDAIENKLKPVIGNRMIYPDGTVNSYIERYLRDQVLKLFEVKQKSNSRNKKTN